jgi:membrane protein implicated in regulation of membrane protease activity
MYWAIAVIVLAIVEIFTPTFFALCLAAGALLGAITASIGMEVSWQLLFFAVGATMAFIFVRPLMMKVFLKKDKVKTGVDALVGRTARVSEAIDPEQNRGRASIDGDDWKAVSIDDSPIGYGQTVVIERVDSTILYVKCDTKNV